MHKDEIIAIGEDIFNHPELGYKENRTSVLVQCTLDSLNIPYEKDLAITGVKGNLRAVNPT